ncbi:AAA family ATPase [Candidatus Sumerlaeota bacterium]|nr:AAA family ATPase [Candidatus Sumerlaeota bacterium]
MAMIEGFRVQNYRILKDATIGKLGTATEGGGAEKLTPLVAVIGKNGTGKSTLFDAFGFLADSLNLGVEEACFQKNRGGFDKLRSSGTQGSISFTIYYRETLKDRPITYELSVDLDKKGRPYVKTERLLQRRKGQKVGRPFSFLWLENGKGDVWKGESSVDVAGEEADKVHVELTDIRQLGIATLGGLKEHPRIQRFRDFIRNWYLSYFTPDAARSIPLAGPQKHLNIHGDNLGNVVQYMEREHKQRFQTILNRIAKKIPGIDKIGAYRSPEDNRLFLQFNDKGFTDPFYAQQMSDGTLKVFSYMLLLEDPDPPPFICIEEPENGLYHKLLESLALEFRQRATGEKNAPQIFITTHQPYFVDALKPEETWILEKGKDGFVTIRRAADDPLIVELVKEGLPLGSLWYSDYLDPR